MADEMNAGMPPVEGEKPKGHLSTTWAIVIIVVVALLIGGGIWYWYSKAVVGETDVKIPEKTASTSASASPTASTTDETTGWKDYSNSTYGFSVKYPKAASERESGASGNMKWMIAFVEMTAGCGSNRQCLAFESTIEVYDNPNNLGSMKWIEEVEYPGQLDKLMISGITVDGTQGKRVSTTLGDEGVHEVVFQSRTKPNLMFVITFNGNSASLENTFSQFLNSFKFL